MLSYKPHWNNNMKTVACIHCPSVTIIMCICYIFRHLKTMPQSEKSYLLQSDVATMCRKTVIGWENYGTWR